MAGWVTIVGSVLVIASVFAQIGALDSLDTRRGVEDTLAQPPLDGLDLQVSDVLEAIRILAMVTGACAAATAILGWQVMQRSRPARLVLSILAVPMFLAGLVAGGFTTSLVAAAALILWLQPSRAWLNGDPVPERFLRPPGDARREQQGHTSGKDAGRPDPFASPPRFEKLVGDLSGAYSRRINIQHLLVYQVLEEEKVVKVLRMWSHYE